MQADSTTQNGLDAEGYIENRCSLKSISPVFRPIVDECITALTSTFTARLHSIYLYGSVATGRAQPGQSDIDILAVFYDALPAADQAEIKDVARSLSALHRAVVREAGIGAVSLQEVFARESLHGLGCFIQHLCVCIAGEDIRPRLPEFRPSVEVARKFNGDYAAVLQKMMNELFQAGDSTAAQPVMSRICRKTVRTAFSLVMPRLNCWTNEPKASVDYFCQYYPAWRTDMTLVCAWIRQPPGDRAQFLHTVTPLATWLTTEFERVIGDEGLPARQQPSGSPAS